MIPRHRVLVVEDNAADVVLAKKALSVLNVEVLVVATAEAALQFLEHEGVDLVLLDLNLPKVSGFELLSRLKSQEATKSIPVVVNTSSSSQDDIRRAFSQGAAGYLVKPMFNQQFRDQIAILGAYWFQASRVPVR